MKEEWKSINGFEGIYEVSNLGRVRSLCREVKQTRRGTPLIYHHKGGILSPNADTGGYLSVMLHCKERGKRERRLIHRLVAEAFIPNTENLPCINHKDENKVNNAVDNLEWCTVGYNDNYGTRLSRMAKANTNNPKRSKRVVQLTLSGDFVREYESYNEVRRNGYYNIWAAAHGDQLRPHPYGYIWKEVD